MNLVICHTPLQVLIACRIIEQKAQENYHAIMFSYENNEKFDFYFHKLSKFCQKCERIILTPQQPIAYWISFKRLVNSLHRHYDTVYCASINSMVVHYLLSHCRFNCLETFDDGTANILPDSIFYRPPTLSLKQKLMRQCLKISWDSQQIIDNSRLHYTLYPQFDNIISQICAISLINRKEQGIASVTDTEKILLGQPLLQDDAANVRLFERIAVKFQIRCYFPHPRERQLPNLEIIETEKIFEDWVTQQSGNLELYHLFSTAGLNTAHLSNISSFAIDIGQLNPYPLSEKTCTLFTQSGIEIIKL